MGGSDTRRRGQRHGQHRSHVSHLGIRPCRQPTGVRHPGGRIGRRRRRRTTAAGPGTGTASVRHERQRRLVQTHYPAEEEVVETGLFIIFRLFFAIFRSRRDNIRVHNIRYVLLLSIE